MLKIFNDDGFLIHTIDVQLKLSDYKKDYLELGKMLSKKLLSEDINSFHLKLKSEIINQSNFKQIFGHFKNGKWIGNGNLYAYCEVDNNILFSVIWKDYYIKSFIIEDTLIDINLTCDYKYHPGLVDDLKFIIRDKKLENLGIN